MESHRRNVQIHDDSLLIPTDTQLKKPFGPRKPSIRCHVTLAINRTPVLAIKNWPSYSLGFTVARLVSPGVTWTHLSALALSYRLSKSLPCTRVLYIISDKCRGFKRCFLKIQALSLGKRSQVLVINTSLFSMEPLWLLMYNHDQANNKPIWSTFHGWRRYISNWRQKRVMVSLTRIAVCVWVKFRCWYTRSWHLL